LAQGNARSDSAGGSGATALRRIPAWRNRIVGVFDAMTYEPVAGADVVDVMSKTSSVTSSTGNLSLFFVPEGLRMVRIRKLGYEPQTVFVSITPEDSSTIAIVLTHVGQTLPGITSTAARSRRGPADTVWALERNGFYDRRNSGLAPASAFLTEERIAGLMLISDVGTVMGRGICTSNVYWDGMKIDVTAGAGSNGRVSRVYRSGIDAVIFSTEGIAAVETYKWGEIPAEFSGMFGGAGSMSLAQGAGSDPCVTLIWSK
jgi:hypothetical protein